MAKLVIVCAGFAETVKEPEEIGFVPVFSEGVLLSSLLGATWELLEPEVPILLSCEEKEYYEESY